MLASVTTTESALGTAGPVTRPHPFCRDQRALHCLTACELSNAWGLLARDCSSSVHNSCVGASKRNQNPSGGVTIRRRPLLRRTAGRARRGAEVCPVTQDRHLQVLGPLFKRVGEAVRLCRMGLDNGPHADAQHLIEGVESP